MTDWGKRLNEFAQDLTHLEVNTIIKANMTGRKMPRPRHALIEIAKGYRLKLVQLGYPVPDDDIRMGGYESFDRIREKAHEGAKALLNRAAESPLNPEEEADLVMLYRVRSMSDQIKGIFNALRHRHVKTWDNNYSHQEVEEMQSPLPLETDELVTIRKIWEMGLEEIAMQTIIQLDGDVLTRIQPRYATQDNAAIHQIHTQSVRMSLKVWDQLIGIVRDFFRTLFKKQG